MAPRRRRLGRVALLLALLASPAACRTWQSSDAPVADAIRTRGPERPARLTLRDGRELTLDSLAVRGDSAVGYTQTEPPARVAVPLADVVRVAERRVDAEGTAANVLTGVALVGLALFVLVAVFLRYEYD